MPNSRGDGLGGGTRVAPWSGGILGTEAFHVDEGSPEAAAVRLLPIRVHERPARLCRTGIGTQCDWIRFRNSVLPHPLRLASSTTLANPRFIDEHQHHATGPPGPADTPMTWVGRPIVPWPPRESRATTVPTSAGSMMICRSERRPFRILLARQGAPSQMTVSLCGQEKG